MEWLHHPKFVRVRDAVLLDLKRKEFHFRKVGMVVFLCGGFQSERRERLAEYLRSSPREVLLFYAEDVWSVIAQRQPEASLLDVEEQLAGLADVVIIIVESPGTFAELGAFAISEPLRKKLVPILDKKYFGQESFVGIGLVRSVDQHSQFTPSIWVSHDRILEAADELEDRLNRIPVERAKRVENLAASPKHLVFFVCDLVSVFGPCPADYITFLAERLLGPQASIDVPFFLGLGKAMGLLDSFALDQKELYFRPLSDGRLRSFQRVKKFIDIPSLRAKVLSVMLACEPGRRALDRLEEFNGAS